MISCRLLLVSVLVLCLHFRCGAAFSRHPRSAAGLSSLEEEQPAGLGSLREAWLGSLPLKRHRNWHSRQGESAFERFFNLGQDGGRVPLESSASSGDNLLRYG